MTLSFYGVFMGKQVQYIKCPRCELNYILKKDKFCDVCKAEMKAGCLEENDMDELDEGLELCPICKVNYIQEGETMCATCMEEQAESGDGDINKDEEPDWRGFVDKADDEDEELDLLPVEDDDEIDEELEGAFAKDLENEFDDEEEEDEEESSEEDDDDFDIVDDDDDFDDDDEDDDEDDEDDDDDDLY